MLVLDGKKINQEIASELSEAISAFGKTPQLLIIQVGENQASDIYIQRKIDFGQQIGATVIVKYFSENSPEKEIFEFIEEKNNDSEIHGIIVQLPIPKKMDKDKVIRTISFKKDVDGLVGPDFVPATARGVITLLEKNNIKIKRKKVVIINDSDLVGKPIAKEMKKLKAKTTICNKDTEDLFEIAKSADILITGIGKPEIIDEKYLRDGQIIIDIGISKTDKGIKGDVKENPNVELFARTPVPGGVGPMTVASLFQNLVEAYKKQ